MAIDFVYTVETDQPVAEFEQDFVRIIETTLNHLHIEDDVELSAIIVDDERIHEINRDYRHIDDATDVISFALEDSEQFYVEGMPRSLGDIFISAAPKQMNQLDVTASAEVNLDGLDFLLDFARLLH